MTTATPTPTRGFFASRWHGDVSLGHLFWADMLIYGTGVNVAAALAAFILMSFDLVVVGVIVYFSPLPFNFFLFGAVWRASAAAEAPWRLAIRLTAIVWVVLMTLI